MVKMIEKEYFVDPGSVVRKIWGQSDVILFIFAGASAEFALNKAVDWLYFTGRLPADPFGRLFSTVSYARAIIFSEKEDAHKAIDAIVKIHTHIEEKRGTFIPDWAYLDVLFMLIDYSIRSYELLERNLSFSEKVEVFEIFKKVGKRMGIKGLPKDYRHWETMRKVRMEKDLMFSHYTADLFSKYRKHLGFIRYYLLLETQKLILPKKVKSLLNMRTFSFIWIGVKLNKVIRNLNVIEFLIILILPKNYKESFQTL